MRAKYAKLKDGETWGISVEDGQPVAGMQVQVFKKDGTANVETIAAVIETGRYGIICSVVPKPRRGGRKPAPQVQQAPQAPARTVAPGCCDRCGQVLPKVRQEQAQGSRAWQGATPRPAGPPQGFTPPPPTEEPGMRRFGSAPY